MAGGLTIGLTAVGGSSGNGGGIRNVANPANQRPAVYKYEWVKMKSILRK